jgi:hypothetical protein
MTASFKGRIECDHIRNGRARSRTCPDLQRLCRCCKACAAKCESGAWETEAGVWSQQWIQKKTS